MKIDPKDIEYRYTKGQGPGGQNKNKVETCVIATHVPTGIQVRVDGRSREQNQKRANKLLEQRVKEHFESLKAEERKARRDEAIHDETTIRTYNYKRNTVTDHRTGKVASLKDVLEKGQIDKLK
jgi:peptide chain release factor 1